MTDTPEEAEYRAKVRKELEDKKAEAEMKDKFAKIKAEEEKRASQKPLTQQAVDFSYFMLTGKKREK